MLYVYIYLSMVLGGLCTLVAITAMRRNEEHNVGKFGWLFLILLTPPIGLCLFLAFGGRRISAEHENRDQAELPPPAEDQVDASCSPAGIAASRELPLPSEDNRLRLLDRPQAMWDALLELIDSAEERLYVQSFILADDAVSREAIKRLCEKSRSGVQVRLLADGFGSFSYPEELFQKLADAGGKAAKFKPLTELSHFAYMSFRNHRKLAVADGSRALLGGANFVETEITSNPDQETWVDYMLRIDGHCARQIESVFLDDWNFATDEVLAPSQTPVRASADNSPEGDLAEDAATLQSIVVGPDGPSGILEDLWLTSIQRAEKRVWIVTPYFVPPLSAMKSLVMAIRCGIEVKIIVPRTSDISIADYARADYLQKLSDQGAQVLIHPERMVHAKMLLVDRTVAFCGSANFDMRSFLLNYELVIGILNESKVDEMAHWYDQLASECIEGPVDRNWARRALGTAARMVAEEL